MTSAPKTPLGAPVTSHSPWWLLLVALARSPGPPAGGCPLSCIIYSRSRLAQHVPDMCSLSSAHVLAPPATSEALPISLGQDEPPGAPFLLELRPAPGPLHVPYPTPGCPFPNPSSGPCCSSVSYLAGPADGLRFLSTIRTAGNLTASPSVLPRSSGRQWYLMQEKVTTKKC